MGQNILITGAAGYIGGSILADFIARLNSPINAVNISVTVRSNDQVKALSHLGINIIQLDLNNETAVMEAVLYNSIDIVIHTASSISVALASNLIKALGERRKDSGVDVSFIHTSVTTMFSEEGGWPFGEVKDNDNILIKEKQIEAGNPVRDTNIVVTELSKALSVVSLIVVVPYTYGRGTGECRKLSVAIPAYIRTAIKHKIVYKFDKDANPPHAHVTDIVSLYALLVEKILSKSSVFTGDRGYYFAISHRGSWWPVMDRIAEAMHARGLVEKPEAKTWPSYEMAAKSVGYPPKYIRAMGMSSGDMIAVNAYEIGWKPKWDENRFLESMDDEVVAVIELDIVKASVFNDLLTDGR